VLRPIAPDGYRGPIELLVAIGQDGRLIGVQVIRHQETPGLGDAFESRDVHWLDRFRGPLADRSADAALDRAARRRRLRCFHRRDDHAARDREGGAQLARVLSAQLSTDLRSTHAMSAGSSSRFGSTARLIAVCPLLAMSDTVADALGIGVVVLIVVPLATAVLASAIAPDERDGAPREHADNRRARSRASSCC
jgi:hypothetical protein